MSEAVLDPVQPHRTTRSRAWTREVWAERLARQGGRMARRSAAEGLIWVERTEVDRVTLVVEVESEVESWLWLLSYLQVSLDTDSSVPQRLEPFLLAHQNPPRLIL